MIRTQIQLTDEQIRKLRRVARAQGVSVAELVRQLIERGMAEAVPEQGGRYHRAARWLGAFRDREGATDVATSHDEYLDQAYQ